jgi:hypothetical protein
MSALFDEDIARDDVAVSMARALVIANRRARQLGIDVGDRLVSVAQRPSADRFVWQVDYLPKQYVGRRGGDFSIEVDPADGSIRREVRGQ